MKFSASMIKKWMACPKQVHFSEILDYPEMQHPKTAYGTCIHDAFELYNKTGDAAKAVERFKETWEDPEILEARIDYWPSGTSWPELRQRGIESITKFAGEAKWEDRTILDVERKFRVPFGDHEFSGIIDSLEIVGKGKNKELRVIDYKTSSRTPTHAQLRFDVQFTIYMYATEQPEYWEGIEGGEELYEQLKGMKRRGVWHSVWHSKILDAGPRNDLDLQRLYRVCIEIENAIEQDVYVPSISSDSCMWCPYTDVCAVTIPVAHAIHEEKRARFG